MTLGHTAWQQQARETLGAFSTESVCEKCLLKRRQIQMSGPATIRWHTPAGKIHVAVIGILL